MPKINRFQHRVNCHLLLPKLSEIEISRSNVEIDHFQEKIMKERGRPRPRERRGGGVLPEPLEGDFPVQLLSRRRKADCQELLPNISALVLTASGVHSLEDQDGVPRKQNFYILFRYRWIQKPCFHPATTRMHILQSLRGTKMLTVVFHIYRLIGTVQIQAVKLKFHPIFSNK